MSKVLAFDVYGTLTDTNGVEKALSKHTQDPVSFSRLWRAKQLEYSFRRGLMKSYLSFTECTRQSLKYTAAYYGVALGREEMELLMSVYTTLPAFPDVAPTLQKLRDENYSLFAFSNGPAAAVKTLLRDANILRYFQDIVSTEEVSSFKPDPAVYRHFAKRAGCPPENVWLVSANSFDVLGAVFFGMKAVWIQRNPAMILDPWEREPTLILNRFADLPQSIETD